MIDGIALWSDTIVAIATPPGIAAIGVIRLSGNKSFEIINKIFPSKDLSIQAPNTLHVGYLKHANTILDEVVISVFKSPNSYTGEDVIEVSCHGSAFIQQGVVNALISYGARLARPGEFTQKAFLNGKMDLVQAEAVADLIASDTSASQNAALKNMRGGFSQMLNNMREQLIQFASLIELELDFSEEDVEFADRKNFIDLIDRINFTVNNLLDSFKLGNVIKNGISVAIIGSPNVGKSTLLNTLLNENRAIVSDIPGTTRDTIEEVINIKGIIFRLIDTAGIHEQSNDVIENMGITKSKEKIKNADIVLYIFDVNTYYDEFQAMSEAIKAKNNNVIYVANKADLIQGNLQQEFTKKFDQAILISAKMNQGIELLKEKLYVQASVDTSTTENIIITNARHYGVLKEISSSLNDIRKGIEGKISTEFLSFDIRRCLQFIGEITGAISNDHMLDYIFSKFCIGK